MPDLTMCSNAECPLRGACYRFRAVPNPRHQSYSLFQPNDHNACDYFEEIDGREVLGVWESENYLPRKDRP